MKKQVIAAVAWVFLIACGCPPLSTAAPHRDFRLEAANQDSGGPGYEEIEKKMKELIDELEKLRNEASQKIRKELIPRLEKEIDRLKEWLHDFRSNPDKEPGTRET